MTQFTYTDLQAAHVKGELARMLHNRTLQKGKGKGGGGAGAGKGDPKGKGKAGKGKALDASGNHIACRFFAEGTCRSGTDCRFNHTS